MPDVAFAGQQPIDLGLVDVETHRAKAGRHKGADQRQADVAQANDAHDGGFLLNRFAQGNCHKVDLTAK